MILPVAGCDPLGNELSDERVERLIDLPLDQLLELDAVGLKRIADRRIHSFDDRRCSVRHKREFDAYG